MKYICVNCNHTFESDETKVRCPSCMRKNSVLTYEEHQKHKVDSNKKKILPAIITIIVLLSVTVIIFLKFKSHPSKYPYTPVSWEQLSKSSEGFENCPLSECYPYLSEENLRKITEKAGKSITEINNYIKQHVIFHSNGVFPSQIYPPEQIAEQLLKKTKINLTTLEAALFLQSVLTRQGITAGIAETDDPEGLHPMEEGKYILILPNKNKIIDDFKILDQKSYKTKFSLLRPEIITARFLALKALSLTLGSINKNDLIIIPEISQKVEKNKNIKTALKYANIAMNIDPSPVTAAGTFFVYYTSHITLKFKSSSSIARNSESPERHVLSAIMLYNSGDPKTALFELNKYENKTYFPFKIALKTLKQEEISDQELANLKTYNCLSGKTLYFSILQKQKAPADKLNDTAKKILKIAKNLQTPHLIVFDYYLKSKQYDKARSLISKLASFSKNPEETQKVLKNMLNKQKNIPATQSKVKNDKASETKKKN